MPKGKRKKKQESFLLDLISNFFMAVKTSVLSPRVYFNEIIDNGSWLEPFTFFSICASVYSLMSLATGFSFIGLIAKANPDMPLPSGMTSPLFFFICFLSYLLAMMIGSFVLSFATTVLLNMLGGKAGFQATYRVMSACWVVLLVSWIPFVGPLLGLYFFVLAWIGLSKEHEIPGWKSMLGVLGGSLGTTVVSVICCIVVVGMLSTLKYHPVAAENPWHYSRREADDPYFRN